MSARPHRRGLWVAAGASLLDLVLAALTVAFTASPAPAAAGAAAPVSARPAPGAIAAPAAGDTAVSWSRPAPGARRAVVLDGDVQILLVEFDLERFRAEVVVGAGSPPRAQTAADLRVHDKAVAAVNGGFFDQRQIPLGLRISRGATRMALRPRVDWGVLVIEDRRARIIHSREFHADAAIRGAIQVGPRLVVEGAPLALKPQIARRTAVALDRDGGKLTLVIVDQPIEAGKLAARLAALGFHTALLLDGGPSTQLSLAVGDARADVPGLYAVPDLLAVYAREPR